MSYTIWLKDIKKNQFSLVGGKGFNLAVMIQIGLPVPNAFVVTTEAYKTFLQKTGIDKQIFDILKQTNVDDTKQLEENTAKIRKTIESTPMPEEIKSAIIQAYNELSREFGKEEEYVAVEVLQQQKTSLGHRLLVSS